MKGIHAAVEVLSQDEIELIHEKSLALLAEVGLQVPNPEVRELAQHFGAQVDPSGPVVKIPRKAMERILDLASMRKDAEAVGAGPLHPLRGKVSTQVHLVDYASGTRRYGELEDVRKGIHLINALDNIPAANAVVVPKDVPPARSDVESFYEIFLRSKKPGGTYVLSPESAEIILDMAEACGREVSYLFETVSPLSFRAETLEIGLIFAKRGQPLAMAPMVMAGATGPVTIAGMLTLQNAEVLGSLFFIYALSGRIPDYVVGGHTIDMRTLLCSFGSPNQALIGIGVGQMARFYGLHSGSNSGLCDSLFPDFQAGVEKGISAIFSLLAGTVEIGCQGIVGADQGFSFQQLVLDNEWISMYNHIIRGVEVNEETIGLDLMKSVGIGGNFIAEEHTVMNLRESYWPSRIFERTPWIKDRIGTTPRALELADEFVRSVLGRTDEYAVTSSQAEDLQRIRTFAERKLK